jgi:cyclic lactone autoinducer peptide
MKFWLAKHANALLSLVAVTFVATSCGIIWHLPEAPQELLKK